MKYEVLRRALGVLSREGSTAESIAVRADLELLEAHAALAILRRRGLSDVRTQGAEPGIRFFLPSGFSEPQAQLLLLIGEHGPASAPELAARLERPDSEVRTDLFILRTAGRIEERGGAWQLVTRISDRTAAAIAEVLGRRAKICEPKAKP